MDDTVSNLGLLWDYEAGIWLIFYQVQQLDTHISVYL